MATTDTPLEELKPPTGVVRPPPEIRVILEKTAGYVARSGAVFEDRIRTKEGDNPKFSFLTPTDAYHPFYQWRLSEIKAGRSTDVSAGRVGEAAVPAKKAPQGPPKPSAYEFSARMPRLSQKDLDVIRLTALFVARNGRTWMTQLTQRETANPQFQFLMPNHTFHTFFQNMVDQYKLILEMNGLDGQGTALQEERIKALTKNIDDKFNVIARAKQRAEYARYEEAEKKKKAEKEEEEKEEFERIDWGDFVVVETITFDDSDDTADLPPPANLADLQYASLETRKQVSISADRRIEEAMPTDDERPVYYPPAQLTTGDFSLPVHPAASTPPLPAAPANPTVAAGSMAPPSGVYLDPYEEQRIRERADAQERVRQTKEQATSGPGAAVKIKENYVPKAQRGQKKAMAICPNCQQKIPMDELQEHMKIELLDPQWKEQKTKAEARYATTNISTADVANNLKRLASQRSDVFEDVQGLSEEELARRKKTGIIGMDGRSETKSGPQMPPNMMPRYGNGR
ncbi:SF3a splicing factor complex subunit [Ceratocystis pirilliformis]|uniref:SF3a splicing factor complex subunit n=1 Tax=Ceratocystis pirilliformis TaxID=259994 RepID=A0ABR3YRB0_9PEZI